MTIVLRAEINQSIEIYIILSGSAQLNVLCSHVTRGKKTSIITAVDITAHYTIEFYQYQ